MDYQQTLQSIIDGQGKILNRAESENRGLNSGELSEYERLESEWKRTFDPNGARRRFTSQFETRENKGTRKMEYHDNEELRKEYEKIGSYFAATNDSETRTLQKDLDVQGGYTILPELTSKKIFADMDNEVFIRRLATYFPVNKADSVGIPVLDTDILDPDFTGEVSEASLDTAMAFGKRALVPHRLVKAIKASRTLLSLSSPDLANFIVGRGRYKLGVAEENAFLNGNGNNEPLGLFVESDLGVSSSRNVSEGNTSSAIKSDGLINAQYNLKAQYLRSAACRWIFHRDVLKSIRKLKDGEGNYLWQAGIGQDRPATILGIPYVLSEYAPNTVTSGLRVGVIADLSFYGIAEHKTIEVQVLTEKYALENCNGYIFQKWIDGGCLIQEAFSMVTLA